MARKLMTKKGNALEPVLAPRAQAGKAVARLAALPVALEIINIIRSE